MPGFITGKKRHTDTNPPFSHSKTNLDFDFDFDSPILPGLPDDVAKYCLALVPRPHLPAMGAVCKKWRSVIKSKEFLVVRKLAGLLEEWLYVLSMDSEGKESFWEVMDCSGKRRRFLSPMPGPMRAGFGLVGLDGKLLVMGGYSVIEGTGSTSADVYEYDSCLNSWGKLPDMNIARYDFACAEVNGKVYAVGGYGNDGNSLSSSEAYDPQTEKWTLIEPLRRPRWGGFACNFDDKLYIMGGRSSFTIGNSKCVDIYNPEKNSWARMKNGCVMVTAHAVVGKRLFCMEWKNQRKMTVFDSVDGSWKMVPIPVNGSSSVGFRFGVIGGKLLLFSLEGGCGFNRTLVYDPDGSTGMEWGISDIKPGGLCLCSVTIEV